MTDADSQPLTRCCVTDVGSHAIDGITEVGCGGVLSLPHLVGPNVRIAVGDETSVDPTRPPRRASSGTPTTKMLSTTAAVEAASAAVEARSPPVARSPHAAATHSATGNDAVAVSTIATSTFTSRAAMRAASSTAE